MDMKWTGVSALFGYLLLVPLAAQQRSPDIHFAGTPQPIVNAMLELARVSADDVVYDLGSGDGRIVIIAAQKYGARGVGVELEPRLVALSRQVGREGGVSDRVTFIQGDLFTTDISSATVVTLWLSATVNARLEAKLKRELRPGSRIVSHQFPIASWTPTERVRIGGNELFLWTVPDR
jgi:cyclopropane fatty-acyl-phospholipid synthase-like methyltransferase